MKSRMIIVAPVVATLVLLGAGGAAYAAASNSDATAPGAIEGPIKEISQPVTQRAYDAAFDKFAQCMGDGGASLAEPATVGSVRQYSYLSDQVEVYNKCYPDFYPYDFAWQIAHEYEFPTQVALRECLVAIGVEPGKDVDTVWAQVQENKIDPVECTLGPEAAANK